MQLLREQKRWRQYYDTLKSFDNLPYAYAITTHKATQCEALPVVEDDDLRIRAVQ